jgi:type IV pilus assembly protein PilC
MIALMLLYVLPEFSKFYTGFEEELPGITVFVLSIADTLRSNWLVILVALVALWLAHRWWKGTESGKRTWAGLLLRFPLFGDIAYKYQISQILHSLAVMLRGGMPLLSSLKDLEKSASNPLFADALATAGRRVSEGDSLTTAIEGTRLETDLTSEMIEVGESTGSLPDMLSNVAEFYDEEVQNRMEALLSLLEPVLLVVMALIISTLLFAMYYPLFNLMGNLGGGVR